MFKIISYDNLTSAVKKVLKGRRRIETENFIALRSHYLFESFFCLPGIEGAHEKGGVEGGVGRFRRAHLVPVPKVDNLLSLNAQLLIACEQDAKRIIAGQDNAVGQRWEDELVILNPLPDKSFDTAEVLTPQVNRKSLATIKGNHYSVPVSYVGQSVEARVNAQKVDIYKQGKLIASHHRCYAQHKMITELDHYLSLLRYKPGALSGSHALAQARQAQQWPVIYDQYWQALLGQYDKTDANRLFVDFLWWARDFNCSAVESVLSQTLTLGSYELDAIKLLMRRYLNKPQETDKLSLEDLGELACYERPIGSIGQYDSLLSTGAVS